MAEPLIERVWAWLHATFPERQIYIRSDGRVQFFTFSPTLQATLAGLSLIFLGWVAFASVNVIFKDRIIAAKDHRYQQMQSTYEDRLADIQVSYDELNGALVSAEDTFKATADKLEAKQSTVARLLDRSCSDCHSQNTVWPWYSEVAPVSWVVIDDVQQGRRHLNLSDWAKYPPGGARDKLHQICKEVKDGGMPLREYLWAHRDRQLTPQEQATICEWTDAERQRLADSR